MLVSLPIGTVVGALAGYFGGTIDDVLVHITELFQTFPTFLLVVVLVAIGNPSIGLISSAIGIASWPTIARLVRAEFRSLRASDFVMAARSQGFLSLRTAWFLTPLPDGALVLTVLSLNLVGDALNDALNPPFTQESIMTSLLTINDLRLTFPGHETVRGLNLTLNAGETPALVGESGCGKSATALSLMRLLPDSTRLQGEILFDGQNLLTLSDAQMRQRRGNQLSMIFQEPMTSLNPVLSIGQQIAETLHVHQQLTPAAARKRAIELLDLVRIPEPARDDRHGSCLPAAFADYR